VVREVDIGTRNRRGAPGNAGGSPSRPDSVTRAYSVPRPAGTGRVRPACLGPLARLCGTALVLALVQVPLLAQDAPGLGQSPAVTVPSDRPLTLDDAVGIALANHPSLSIAANQVRAARAATTQARSGLLPSLGFRLQGTHSESSGQAGGTAAGTGVVGSTSRSSTQYGATFSVSQLLYDFGRTNDDVLRSRFDAQATDLTRAQTQDDVVSDVRQAYLALLTNRELLEVAGHRVQLAQETLELTQAQYATDQVPRADVAKAESSLASARLAVTSAENAVAVSRVNLNQAMGLDVRTSYSVAPALEPEPPALTLDDLIAAAGAHRPEILAGKADTDAAEAALSAASKGQRPSLSASASYGWSDREFPPSNSSWDVGLALSMSISDGKLTQGRTEQARAQRDLALAAEYQTSQAVAQETAQAFLDLQTALEQMASARVSVESAREALALANGRYRANVGILLEVLDAQTALTSGEADLAQAKFSYLSSYYALERAIGVPLQQVAQARAGDAQR